MRDPKAHAKVLALREIAVDEARGAAQRSGDHDRYVWLAALQDRVEQELDNWTVSTGWRFASWANPPRCEFVPQQSQLALEI